MAKRKSQKFRACLLAETLIIFIRIGKTTNKELNVAVSL